MRDNPYRKLDDEFDHAAEALTWDEGYEAALDDVRAFVHDGEGADAPLIHSFAYGDSVTVLSGPTHIHIDLRPKP